MKLQLIGHSYQYAAEQIMMVLFPGEKPEYGECGKADENCAAVKLTIGGKWATATTRLQRDGKSALGISRVRVEVQEPAVSQ